MTEQDEHPSDDWVDERVGARSRSYQSLIEEIRHELLSGGMGEHGATAVACITVLCACIEENRR